MKKTNLILPVLTRKNAFRCGVVALALVTMTGCKDDAPGENGGNQPEQPELTTDSYTVKTSDANRVHNYATTGSRAAIDDFTMPQCPEIPEDVATTTGIGETEGWKITEGTDYLIPAGETFNAACKLTAKYYVAGTWNTINGFWGVEEGAEIYILPGGTLNVGSTLQPGLTIYNYGTIVSEGLTIANGVKLYSAVDITECKEFGVNDEGELYSKNTIMAEKVRLNGNAIACSFIADDITINSVGTIKASYFKAGNLTMNSGCVVLDNNGLIDADVCTLSNADTRIEVETGGTNAVFATRKFITNNLTWPKKQLAAEIAYDITEAFVESTKHPLNDFEFQRSNENITAYVPAEGCHPAYPEGTTKPEPTPEIIIEKITDIDPLEPDHDHGVISATCITFDGNKAYASYHLRGEGQKGCIEVMEPADNGVKLLSYMISPDYDFNHLIVDEGNIITVGNHTKKGAFIASLPVGFEASETVREDLKVKELTTDEVLMVSGKDGEIKGGYKNAGDGNCVIRHGNNYYVNTYRGYGALNLDFSKVEGSFVPTNGSSKHIDIANGKAAIISLDTYNTTESASTVNVYNADDKMFTTILDTYAAGTISPIDGKNVIAIDGENIYACLGKGGLVRLNDNASFHAGENGKVPANGMAIDDKYIYAAMGSFVFVLNKTDLSEVTHYHASSLKSANYIALHDGLIYVAFGEDGIQVFRLVEK